MTNHIHTCSPGCMECDRAERIAYVIDSEVTGSLAQDAAAEIRALHAQREALTKEVARLREVLKKIAYATLEGPGSKRVAIMMRSAARVALEDKT